MRNLDGDLEKTHFRKQTDAQEHKNLNNESRGIMNAKGKLLSTTIFMRNVLIIQVQYKPNYFGADFLMNFIGMFICMLEPILATIFTLLNSYGGMFYNELGVNGPGSRFSTY